MTLLTEVVQVLRRESIPHAVIGASALAAYGVSRATADVDLLTNDTRCLTPAPWVTLTGRCDVDIRRGDADDPLAGVVRFSRPGDMDIDLVVGRRAWQHECVLRADATTIDGIPIVSLPDLVLLKLYAGGPQDAWDIHQVLDLDADRQVRSTVDARVVVLPKPAIELWHTIVRERSRSKT